MLTDKYGFKLLKDLDNSSLDVSAFFDRLFRIYKDDIVEFPPQMEKWVSMTLEEINKNETYQILPIRWRIEILESIRNDQRFLGEPSAFEVEIENLRKIEEHQIRNNIYNKTFELVLKSKKDAISFILDWQSKTKQLIIQSSSAITSEKDLWKERMSYLIEFENWVKHSYFEEVENTNQEIDAPSDQKNETKIENEKIEDIERLSNTLTSKIVLLYELDLYSTLKKRIEDNGCIQTDLARLIAYVINHDKVNSVNGYLSIRELDPFNTNYEDPQRDSPFTNTAIKKMKRILLECNLKPIKTYPEKSKLKPKHLSKK